MQSVRGDQKLGWAREEKINRVIYAPLAWKWRGLSLALQSEIQCQQGCKNPSFIQFLLGKENFTIF